MSAQAANSPAGPAAAAPLLNHSGPRLRRLPDRNVPSPWLPGLHGNVSHHGQVAAGLLAWRRGMHGPALVTSLPGPPAAPPRRPCAVLGRNGRRPPSAPNPLPTACTGAG